MDDALLSKFLSGEATDDEIARLRAEIEADPAAVDAVFEAAELERDLGELFRAGGVVSAPTSRRRYWIFFASAAALLIAIVVAAAILKEPPREVVRVAKLEGKCLRLGSSGRSPLAVGETLFAGEGVETNGKGHVVLRFEDGTTVDLAAGTAAKGLDTKGGKTIVLERGSLTGDVPRQPADQPMVVRTPEGDARVLGTRFTVVSSTGSTRLDVEKGQVRLTRRSDGASADVSAGQMAIASSGTALAARPTAATVARMAPGTWLAVPETRMQDVAPDPKMFPATLGRMGPGAVVSAWSGGIFDTRRNRLVLWGGGHTDYHGNEIYAFALDTMSWQRVNDPTPGPRLGQDENDDGTPNARATYNGLAYLSDADRLFALSGGLAGSGEARAIWLFDFEAKKWTRKGPSGQSPKGGFGRTCAYDPVTRKLWWGEKDAIYSYDVGVDRWSKFDIGDLDLYYLTSTVDTKRGLWVIVGDGKVFACDIRGATPTLQRWTTTGGAAFIAKPSPGLDYDPVRDRIVGWFGGAVYALDPDTKAWTSTDAPGAPPPTGNGIFGRWRYVPAVDAFVVVTASNGNVHFFKPARP